MSRNCKSLVKESARRIWDKNVAQEGREEVNGAQEGRVEEVDILWEAYKIWCFWRDGAPNRLMMTECIIEASNKWFRKNLKIYELNWIFLWRNFSLREELLGINNNNNNNNIILLLEAWIYCIRFEF